MIDGSTIVVKHCERTHREGKDWLTHFELKPAAPKYDATSATLNCFCLVIIETLFVRKIG